MPDIGIKKAHHHWWPKSLLNFWKNGNGEISQLFPSGHTVVQTSNRKIAGINDAHTARIGDQPSVWDQTFEHSFQDADQTFTSLVPAVEKLRPADALYTGPFSSRICSLEDSDLNRKDVLECCISLIARSPMTRDLTAKTVGYYRDRMSDGPSKTSNATMKNLVNLNHQHALKTFREATAHGGKFCILFAGEGEFIFGDGFFHNFSSIANAPMAPHFLIPLTPKASILYARPLAYNTAPLFSAMTLSNEEVGFANSTVMTYSRSMVFYRTIRPEITEEFKSEKHLIYEEMRENPVTQLIGELAAFRG